MLVVAVHELFSTYLEWCRGLLMEEVQGRRDGKTMTKERSRRGGTGAKGRKRRSPAPG